MQTARDAGIDVCFANPGTTEMPLVAAMDSVPGFRAILGLFEGVCTGAADGYGRMTDRAAMTLLHLGPGLANGIANLHNARRAGSPVVNLVGDHTTSHAAYDAPLTSDILSLARPVSGWVHTNGSAKELAADFAAAVAAAVGPPSQVATLIIPADCQWEAAEGPVPIRPSGGPRVDGARVEAAAKALHAAERPTLLLGGPRCGRRACAPRRGWPRPLARACSAKPSPRTWSGAAGCRASSGCRTSPSGPSMRCRAWTC